MAANYEYQTIRSRGNPASLRHRAEALVSEGWEIVRRANPVIDLRRPKRPRRSRAATRKASGKKS